MYPPNNISSRSVSIDFLRGLVVIFMALDHTQYFWSHLGLPNDGLAGYFPVYPNGFWQLTRFLGHLCAPTFLFLVGMMMAWRVNRVFGRKKMLIRALILILFQITLENFAWWPAGYISNQGYLYFGILSCIGISMCIYVGLSLLNPLIVLLMSGATILISQLIVPVVPSGCSFLEVFSIVSYVPTIDERYLFSSLFTVFQWMGYMGIGYFMGTQIEAQNLNGYKKRFVILGICLLGAFIIVRSFNGFGNFLKWQSFTVSQFMTLSKYPPDLSYTLLMLGLMFAIWGIFIHFQEKFPKMLLKPILLFGQTALFFYVVHLYVYGSVAYIHGGRVGVSLPVVWGVWFSGLIIMYFLCSVYFRLKQRYPNSFLKYV